MIQIIDKSQCCGCSACAQRCPKQCIVMREDEEGFLYPKVDTLSCIDCRLCEKVCPVLHQNEKHYPLFVYAAYNRNEDERANSSSGGVFTLLAKNILSNGGVVFGAKFTQDWQVEHGYIDSDEQIKDLRGSKYVQSRIGRTYLEVEHFLKSGRLVLFSGTPCQVSALRLFLRKEYVNLILVEIFCHGVPSPMVWKKYLEELKRTKHIGEFKDIHFRDKITGWKHYSFSIDYDKKGRSYKKSEYYTQNIYMKGFLNDLFLRPSCFSCPCKMQKSGADLTLGDFWGIQHIKPEIDDDKGVTALLVNSEKGEKLLSQLYDLKVVPFQYDDVVSGNPALIKSPIKTEKRANFYFFIKDRTVIQSISELTKLPLILSCKIWLYNKLKRIIG